ncbi:glycosyltransferase family 4 protein [Mesorhizobium sp. B283B1A]|uniref:glycosyltransferase family 4 protein n=1 Tax=Mesorhizobium TaxID=68287 RepID=UPI001CD0AF2E|nr:MULTISPECIES: glycosyltransferase family 4 protein [Mesorhizobium]MCA0051271.1 glycosyltransferase family 4 protein [Mesorhizobium sp. B283B1A]UQS62992.1 glycosyltransferase family 4 protein [Mesorhizobium opportunistum]
MRALAPEHGKNHQKWPPAFLFCSESISRKDIPRMGDAANSVLDDCRDVAIRRRMAPIALRAWLERRMAGNGMLRILRITPHFYRPGNWPIAFDPVGGLQNQTWTIAQAMDKAGATQTVLTSYIPGSPRHVRISATMRVTCTGFRLPEFLAGPMLCFSWFLGAIPELLRARRRYDVVHIHFNHSVWCRIIAVIVGRLRIPLVVSMNTPLWSGLQSALRLKGKSYDVTRWLERLALRSADRVVVLTDTYGRSAASELGLDASRIEVIPDAVDVEAFRRPVAPGLLRAFRREHGIPDERPIVSFIGRISGEKGWQDLPALVERLSGKNVFLLICGDGPDRRKLEAALAAISRPGWWAITGFVSPAEVKKALKISDVMILPSRREVFGSVLLEAMAAEVPVVAYGVGGVTDVAGRPEALALVSEGRREGLADLTLRLLADSEERNTLIARGRRRVRDFSLDSAVALNLALYASVLAGSVNGSRQPAGVLTLQEDGGSPDGA